MEHNWTTEKPFDLNNIVDCHGWLHYNILLVLFLD